MQLYVILDTQLCDVVSVAEQIAAAGANYVQVRDFKLNDNDYTDLALGTKAALGDSTTKLILSERPHLVPRVGAAGVHIGEKYRDIQTAREEIGEAAILGVSQFTPDFIFENIGADFPVDYLSVGPVWVTTSKPDAGAAIGVSAAAEKVANNPYRSAVIGGIRRENIGELADSIGREGDALIVVLGEVCRAENPAAVVRELKAALDL